MKNIILIIVTAFFWNMGITPVVAQDKKDTDYFEVTVAGLGCPFCAYGLEKKLKEFKGVKKLKMNLESGDVSFTFPSHKTLALTDVELSLIHISEPTRPY